MNNVNIITETEQTISVSPWGVTRQISGINFHLTLHLSPYNQRITILEYRFDNQEGLTRIVSLLNSLAVKNTFGKVWGKIKEPDVSLFLNQGFVPEAKVFDYFSRGEDAVICAKFFFNRKYSRTHKENDQVLAQLQDSNSLKEELKLPANYYFKIAESHDLLKLAELYRKVFLTYPYPVYNPDYLKDTMEHTTYGLIYKNDFLVAAAAAEINHKFNNAEMTDFATLPAERSRGLASIILQELEKQLYKTGIKSLYTIARSTSSGMNLVFSRAGYQYTGTLINNCNIAGNLEDMNVLCKVMD